LWPFRRLAVVAARAPRGTKAAPATINNNRYQKQQHACSDRNRKLKVAL
jgi:hypothetical protein